MKLTSLKFLLSACFALATCFLSSNCSADVSLAVDFTGTDNGGGVAAVIGDFQAQDAALDSSAAVNFIQTDGGGGFNAEGDVFALTGTATGGATPGAISSSVTLLDIPNDPARTGTNGGFNAGFFDGTSFAGIVNDYLTINGQDNILLEVDTSAIVAGSTVTFVAYSHGDQDNQVAGLELTAGGQVQTSGLTTAAQPFQTFTFVQGVGETSLTLELLNDTGNSQFGAINGFSISSVAPAVPEPSSLMLLAMGTLGLVVRRKR